jgi:hypothetical protein
MSIAEGFYQHREPGARSTFVQFRTAATRAILCAMPDRSRCPNCREPVSPYAAGCAICGADLDPKRWDSGPGVLNRIGSWLSALSFGPAKGGLTPWIVVFLIFFGTGIISTLLALFL